MAAKTHKYERRPRRTDANCKCKTEATRRKATAGTYVTQTNAAHIHKGRALCKCKMACGELVTGAVRRRGECFLFHFSSSHQAPIITFFTEEIKYTLKRSCYKTR